MHARGCSYFCMLETWFISWWCHQMETFSVLLTICTGNWPVTGEFPSQRPVTRSFDVFYDLGQMNGWVNNPEAGDLRRHCAHCDVRVMCRERSEDIIPFLYRFYTQGGLIKHSIIFVLFKQNVDHAFVGTKELAKREHMSLFIDELKILKWKLFFKRISMCIYEVEEAYVWKIIIESIMGFIKY